MTLVELTLGMLLGLVVMLAAGVVHQGVSNSFRTCSHKLVAQQEASLLAKTINRRVRVAASYSIYEVPNRAIPLSAGDGLALMDSEGAVISRFEWDEDSSTLADSTGARVTAMSLQGVQFRSDAAFPETVFYGFRMGDGTGSFVDIESASTVRN